MKTNIDGKAEIKEGKTKVIIYHKVRIGITRKLYERGLLI